MPGNRVKILPSGVETVIEEITSMDGALDRHAEEGASIAVTLKDEVDASRGDMIVEAGAPARIIRPVQG